MVPPIFSYAAPRCVGRMGVMMVNIGVACQTAERLNGERSTEKDIVVRRLAFVLGIAAIFPAAAATPAPPSDADLIAACAHEIAQKLAAGVPGQHANVVASSVARTAQEDRVSVTVASGEGRSLSGTCRFRGGRLFDVRS